jgi:hypothetical protein
MTVLARASKSCKDYNRKGSVEKKMMAVSLKELGAKMN